MAAVRVFISLLLIVHYARAQKSSENSTHVLLSPQTLISFLLLGLTVTLSGSVYIWILRYVCIGCCQPVAVGPESEALAVMV
ncbi:hypothetical protein FQA47_004320 [Oryzias melastigma]|uniref:Uncharacterized protein n=1 Tax=Oryzias melastigma TaxID=30732 RepID=A0A834CER9_ORYME|nr:hypothetical protein FQA47_004320 [Oryzias melastigma]